MMESEGKMTTTDARGWINVLIKAMHEETSGSWPDPEYKDEIYSALGMAIQALSQEPCDKCKYFDGNSCQHYDYEVGYAQGYEDSSNRFRQEPCEDAISREDAREAFFKWFFDSKDLRTVDEVVDKLPSVTPKPSEHFIDGVHAIGYREGYKDAQKQKSRKWIPVSERLPEESDCCLCCDKDGYMTIGGISKWSKEWYFDDDEVDMDVVAWMPLPEPYKAESEDKTE